MKSNILKRDLQTNEPLVFITKNDLERRTALFTKTFKEKEAIASIKSAHKRIAKGKINTSSVSRQLSEELISHFNSRLGFNLTKFNGIPLV